jgi:hypothetical protein
MKITLIILSMVMLVVTPLITIAKGKTEIPEYTVEGLKLIPDTENIAAVWADEGVDLAQYERVYLAEPLVAFKKNWQRDFNRSRRSPSAQIRTDDMEHIKTELGALFVELFTAELEEGGYTLADERAEDVLIVKPAIINLDVTAPDIQTGSRSSSFTTSAGSMTLYLELYDSVTDDLLVKAMDPTYDRDYGTMQWSTSVSNRAAASRMMKPWAKALRNGLDKSKEVTKQE